MKLGQDETVERIMTRPPRTVESDAPLSEVRRLLRAGRFHHLPVMKGRRLVGLVSAADLLRFDMSAYGVDRDKADAVMDAQFTLEEIMQRELVTIGPREAIRGAAALLAQGHFHALPVVDRHGELLGIVTSTDLIRCLLEGT